MTGSRVTSATLSANEIFKSQYHRTLRWSGLVAALLTLALAWFSPRYTAHPYKLRAQAQELIEVEVIYEEITPPKVAPPPVIPPEIAEVPNEEPDAIDPPEFGEWDGIFNPAPPVTVPNDDGFVASSSKPVLLTRPKPRYPEIARLAQVEGLVTVKVLVGVDGKVEAAVVLQGIHPLLDRAALKAAWGCTFEPGRQRRIKVPTWVAVPYNFRLR